mmetsp:Transcript_61020/g.176706  ORF Transcript_61020/g.176706 Transcript_61020/m.176706 type:complete len:235 (+) Transcript_61020:1145-1849(+)
MERACVRPALRQLQIVPVEAIRELDGIQAQHPQEVVPAYVLVVQPELQGGRRGNFLKLEGDIEDRITRFVGNVILPVIILPILVADELACEIRVRRKRTPNGPVGALQALRGHHRDPQGRLRLRGVGIDRGLIALRPLDALEVVPQPHGATCTFPSRELHSLAALLELLELVMQLFLPHRAGHRLMSLEQFSQPFFEVVTASMLEPHGTEPEDGKGDEATPSHGEQGHGIAELA